MMLIRTLYVPLARKDTIWIPIINAFPAQLLTLMQLDVLDHTMILLQLSFRWPNVAVEYQMETCPTF
jgi:hypothetical protein